jgi:hypothetical protein
LHDLERGGVIGRKDDRAGLGHVGGESLR